MEKELPKAPYHYSEGAAYKRFCRLLAEQIIQAWQSGQLYRGEDGKVCWREENQCQKK